jgi:hypothetical protein
MKGMSLVLAMVERSFRWNNGYKRVLNNFLLKKLSEKTAQLIN